MSIGAQGAVVDPTIGNRIDDLPAGAAEHVGRHRGGGQPDQDDVIQADPVEGIEQRIAALDLVGLDGMAQQVAYRHWRAAFAARLPAQIVSQRQEGAQVVGRMPPFGGQPGVVEIQPADLGADRERRLDGIQFMGRSRYPDAAGHLRAGYYWSQVAGALGKLRRQHRAGQRIQQHPAGGVVGLGRVDAMVDDVVGHLDHRRIGIRAARRTQIILAHGASLD